MNIMMMTMMYVPSILLLYLMILDMEQRTLEKNCQKRKLEHRKRRDRKSGKT